MRFGCCLNMIAEGADGTGIEFLEQLVACGYDYAELPLAQMMDLSEDEFGKLKHCVDTSGVNCEVCNNFFPTGYRLTGPDADMEANLNYAAEALERAHRLGVKYVVFGSGPAKNVPDGFPLEQGYQQVVSLLQQVNDIAHNLDITIVIEPLRRQECNLINTFEEGCRLARAVDRENVKVLVDFYHLTEEKEPVEHLLKEGKEYLRHVHFARPDGRVYPESIEEETYQPFIDALKAISYDGRVSCEAYTHDYGVSAPKALAFFKKYFS